MSLTNRIHPLEAEAWNAQEEPMTALNRGSTNENPQPKITDCEVQCKQRVVFEDIYLLADVVIFCISLWLLIS